MQRLLVLVTSLVVAVPTKASYDVCNVEDGGLVETTANTGIYVGLRQGCAQNDNMVRRCYAVE